MLNLFRAPLGRITGPVGRWLVARGVSPDAVTVAGTVGTAAAAVVFIRAASCSSVRCWSPSSSCST